MEPWLPSTGRGPGRPKRQAFTAEHENTPNGQREALLRRESLFPCSCPTGAGRRTARCRRSFRRRSPGRPARSAESAESELLRKETRRWRPSSPARRPRWRSWESARALGADLRERGFRKEAGEVIDAAVAELVLLLSQAEACRIAGKSRGNPAPAGEPEAVRRRKGARAREAAPAFRDRAAYAGVGSRRLDLENPRAPPGILDAAYAAYLERFRSRPVAPKLPDKGSTSPGRPS